MPGKREPLFLKLEHLVAGKNCQKADDLAAFSSEPLSAREIL